MNSDIEIICIIKKKKALYVLKYVKYLVSRIGKQKNSIEFLETVFNVKFSWLFNINHVRFGIVMFGRTPRTSCE